MIFFDLFLNLDTLNFGRCNTSLLIDYCCEEEDGRHYYIIIDVGKSFREQVLRWFTFYKIPRIDSVKPLRYLLLYLLHILLLMSNDIILLCVDHSNSWARRRNPWPRWYSIFSTTWFSHWHQSTSCLSISVHNGKVKIKLLFFSFLF